jgi:hypothetical protein
MEHWWLAIVLVAVMGVPIGAWLYDEVLGPLGELSLGRIDGAASQTDEDERVRKYYQDKQTERPETIYVDVEAMLEESAAKAGIQADREEESLDRKPGISR